MTPATESVALDAPAWPVEKRPGCLLRCPSPRSGRSVTARRPEWTCTPKRRRPSAAGLSDARDRPSRRRVSWSRRDAAAAVRCGRWTTSLWASLSWSARSDRVAAGSSGLPVARIVCGDDDQRHPEPDHERDQDSDGPAGPRVHRRDSSQWSEGPEAQSKVRRRISSASSTSASPITSGGRKRRVSAPIGFAIRPSSRRRSAVSRASGPSRRAPTIRPRPRTSPIASISSSPSQNLAPRSRTLPQQLGVVDHVEGGEGGGRDQGPAGEGRAVVAPLQHVPPEARSTQAPTGSPPPSAFAVVITSGRTGSCS